MKIKTSNNLRISDQLISPKSKITALTSVHQKKNSSLDTTNISNSFNFGKAHSRHISANSNSNDYGAKNYLSIESASILEKENNQNISNVLPFGQQTFSQQDFDQNNCQFMQYLSPPFFKEDECNKMKNNQNNSFNQSVPITPMTNENNKQYNHSQQLFSNFETLSALQQSNQGGYYQIEENAFNYPQQLQQQQQQQPQQQQQSNYYDNFNNTNISSNQFIGFNNLQNNQINQQIGQGNGQMTNQNLAEKMQLQQQHIQQHSNQQINAIPHHKSQSQQFFIGQDVENQELNNNNNNFNIPKEVKHNNNRHHSNPPHLNLYNINKQNNPQEQNTNFQAQPQSNQFQQSQDSNHNSITKQKIDKEIEISKLPPYSPCFNSSQESSKRSLNYSNAHNSSKKTIKQINGKERLSQIISENQSKHPNISYDAIRRVKTEADDQANLDEDSEFTFYDHNLLTSKTSMNIVVAKFDYKRRNENELSFSQGDQIQVIDKIKKWWYGICKNQIGFFPCNYVENLNMA